MRTEADRWLGALFHGWVELVTLFGILVVALAIIGWCYNRGFRPADRGPLISWALLLSAYGLVLVLRHMHDQLWSAIIIAVGLALAGLLGRGNWPRGLWVPVILLATLLGLGLHLSAIVLMVIMVLVLLLSSGRSR